MRRLVAALLVLAGLLGAPALLDAQTSEERDLQALRRQISQLESRLQGLRSREQSAEIELRKVDLELELRNRELAAAEKAVVDLEADQRLIEKRLHRLSTDHREQKEFLARRMRALYKMGGLSYLRLLFSARTDENMLDSIGMLNYLIQRDAKAIAGFRAMKVAIDAESTELARRKIEVENAHETVVERQASVEAKRGEKRQLLARIRDESRRSESRLSELTEKAERLQRLMDLLYERGSRETGGVSMREVRGALSWPVDGEVVARFGRERSERFATFTINNGLTIAAPPGTDVRSIFDGTVLYAQWFKGYGNLVILDHGDRIFSLYGNLRASTVSQGDTVRAGETIGIVGESEEEETGALYFEIRENNQPIDPVSWLR